VISSATLDLEGGAIEPPVARTRRNAPLRRMATACVRHWPALIAIAVFLTIVRAWFGPGLIAGEDFGAFGWSDIDYLRAGGPWPSAWDPTYGFGLNTQLWSTMFPVLCLAGLAARAGATWSVIERIFVLVPLAALITCVPYAFAYRVLRDRWAAAVAALLFAVNTWTIGLIERGHLPSLIAYALIPPFAYLCIRAVAAPSVRRGIALGGAGFASTLFEPRYTYMAAIAGGLLWIAGVLQRRSPLPWRAYGTFWAAFAASTLLDLAGRALPDRTAAQRIGLRIVPRPDRHARFRARIRGFLPVLPPPRRDRPVRSQSGGVAVSVLRRARGHRLRRGLVLAHRALVRAAMGLRRRRRRGAA
jgi:hypothetical protein